LCSEYYYFADHIQLKSGHAISSRLARRPRRRTINPDPTEYGGPFVCPLSQLVLFEDDGVPTIFLIFATICLTFIARKDGGTAR